jgi:hypothetical protein
MIYVYTSILNGWDNLRPPSVEKVPNVRYICFTNVPNLPDVEPWEFRPIYLAGDICRTARVPKILPHLLLPANCEYSIYHDGNLRLSKHPVDTITRLLGSHDWAAHRHPCRNCIYDEARILLKEQIGTAELIEREIASYRENSHPEAAGLWANGFIARRHNEATARLNERWWQLYSAGCERDQISFPVARLETGVEVSTIDANIYESPFVDFFWHAAWKDKPSSREFHTERDGVRERLEELKRLTGFDGGVNYPDC